MFRKLKISNKLLLTFGATTLLLVGLVAISSHTITKFRHAVQSMQHADELKTLLDQEEKGILQLLAGFDGGSEQYARAHQKVGELKSAVEGRATRRDLPLITLINSESQVNELLGSEDEGFFEEYSAAREGFIEKNNKHVRRVLGYKNAWVDPGTAKDNQVLGILDNIRNERILVEDFNPESADADVVLGDFRAANDAAVAGLVDLWEMELDTLPFIGCAFPPGVS